MTALVQNASLLWCDRTMEGAVVDPGGEVPRLLAAADRLDIVLKQILLTHAHIDHAGGVGTLARERGLPQQATMFGFPQAEPFTPSRWLADGDTVHMGACELAVRLCPGHTPGYVVFRRVEAQRAFVGDVLLAGSVGRSDFPDGA